MIRDAVLEDIPFIVEEGIKFLQYHPAKIEREVDVDHLHTLVNLLISEHVLLIAEQDGVQTGMIAGLIVPNMYNRNYVGLQEMFWWVVEDKRNTPVAFKLYKTFEQTAKELGVDFISMVTTTYTPTLEKYYKKQGFIPVESSFIKEL